MTGMLSSYFGKSLLDGEQPLRGPALAGGDEFTASPDTLLFENTVPAPQLPSAPPAVQTTRNEPGTVAAPPGAAAPHGDAALAISAAMGFVGSMYEWGGTGADGRVDCSGLLYAAFNKAGIDMPRYRAVDYGHMGAPVSTSDARPGDVVYFDNPNSTTDHVGLYIGNGQFIEAPRPGEQVRVSKLRSGAQIRRVLPDSAMDSLPVDTTGRLTFHADNTVFTGAKAPATHPGVQRDPLEQLAALDASQSLGAIEHTSDVSGILDSFGNATPDSIFGQAHGAAMDLAGLTQPPGRPSAPVPAGGGHGLTVGQATGLSASEAWIITHESSGQTGADNPHSTAFGFGQLLADNRQKYGRMFGFSPDTRDAGEQLVMFRAYVRDRYGTAENAEKFWRENGWY